MSETYTCAACGGVFHKGWSDAEAVAEAKRLWNADELEEGVVVICDPCFQRGMARHGGPAGVREYAEELRRRPEPRSRADT